MKSHSLNHIAIILLFILTLTTPLAFAQNTAVNPNLSNDQRIQRWLSTQDPDNDSRISLAESTGLMKSNFKRNDANNDGFLDEKELDALATRLSGNAARPATNSRTRANQTPISDKQLRESAPQNINLDLNIPYNDQHERQVLDIFYPKAKSDTPRPAVVFIHGGGWVNGDKRRGVFLTLALEYASRGYVTLTTNYRLDNTKLPCIQDTKTAVRWLRANAEKYNVDPKRIGAFGNSAGAHLVTMLGISHTDKSLDVGPYLQYSSAVQAVAAAATPTAPNLRNEGATEADKKLIAPMSYIAKDVPPFLLFHEESDRTVPVSNSDDFVAALKKAGAKNITYKRYTDGSGHGVFGKNAQETHPQMRKFFDENLNRK